MEQTNERAPGVYLADETFVAASAGYADGDLWIWTENENEKTLVEMVMLFGDPLKTAKISCVVTGDTVQEWEGFTRLTVAKIDADGIISIRMRKED